MLGKPRVPGIAVAGLLVAGGAASWLGSPESELSMRSVFAIWSDVLRDADSLGLQPTRVRRREEMELGKKIADACLLRDTKASGSRNAWRDPGRSSAARSCPGNQS